MALKDHINTRIQAEEGNQDMKKKNTGSTLDSLLRKKGLYEDVSAAAIKRVVARREKAVKPLKGSKKG